MSEVVGFLYMPKDILSVVFVIESSRKFHLFSCYRSSVKFRFVVVSLNELSTCSISVTFSL